MAKKSITPSIRMNEEDYKKFKELKEKYNISWTKFIACANELLEKDLKDNGIKSNSGSIQKNNH